jgi:copper oxidase (laccase) domain-containing protein
MDREAALCQLEQSHAAIRAELGVAEREFATVRQVHGAAVARVSHGVSREGVEADALITDDPRVCLGIYVADCCAVYLVDPERRAIGLVHSGRKGSELGAAAEAIRSMREEFGCDPARMIAQLSPCIRPPHYEVDFAAQIVEQCRAAGLRAVHDSRTCTACHLERYYSYRLELGRTGRMLALLALPAAT